MHVKHEFGMCVQVAPPSGDVVGHIGQTVLYRHSCHLPKAPPLTTLTE
jgi:hypothetical protein